jgi:DNA-binding NtrC family response regulator
MTPTAILRERFGRTRIQKSVAAIRRPSGNPTVLVATVDLEIRDGLSQLLEATRVNAIWVHSVEDVKALVSREKIAACLCGFWLQDGTYREVIRHLRRERSDIPAIIVSAPTCPHEYGEYLAAMNIGALDFLRYPYQQAEFERMLESAMNGELDFSRRRTIEEDRKYLERGAA